MYECLSSYETKIFALITIIKDEKESVICHVCVI
jgi:hypothetical protein